MFSYQCTSAEGHAIRFTHGERLGKMVAEVVLGDTSYSGELAVQMDPEVAVSCFLELPMLEIIGSSKKPKHLLLSLYWPENILADDVVVLTPTSMEQIIASLQSTQESLATALARLASVEAHLAKYRPRVFAVRFADGAFYIDGVMDGHMQDIFFAILHARLHAIIGKGLFCRQTKDPRIRSMSDLLELFCADYVCGFCGEPHLWKPSIGILLAALQIPGIQMSVTAHPLVDKDHMGHKEQLPFARQDHVSSNSLVRGSRCICQSWDARPDPVCARVNAQESILIARVLYTPCVYENVRVISSTLSLEKQVEEFEQFPDTYQVAEFEVCLRE